MSSLFALLEPGPFQILLLLGIGIIFFGRKLPDIARSLGKGIVEFKKGLRGLEDDLDSPGHQPQVPYQQPVEAPRPPQKVTTTAPKFEEQPPALTPPTTAVTPPPKV